MVFKVEYSGQDTTNGNRGKQRRGHHNGKSNVDYSGEDTTAGRYIIVGIVDGVEVQFEICVNKNSAGEGQGV